MKSVKMCYICPMQPRVSIIMGSSSDWTVMIGAAEALEQCMVPFEVRVVSAHRTPLKMVDYSSKASERGIQVIIAGAGGAAHLPGMVASMTSLPVIGVPVKSSNSIEGWDSILSILQMPSGVPVATVSLNGAHNAGLLAARILGILDENIRNAVDSHRKQLSELAKLIQDIHHFKFHIPYTDFQ